MRSLTLKIDELHAVVSINHADIICITETWGRLYKALNYFLTIQKIVK